MFVPKTFGQFGHYRGAAVAEAEARKIHYAGREACFQCHDDKGAQLKASYHRTLACEVCHGPAADHVAEPEAHHPVIPRKRGEACLYCHAYQSSRPTGFPQIIESTHNPMQPCIDCHNPHDPKPPATPSTCAACHAEIARTKDVSRHNRLECTTCHETPPEHLVNPRAAVPKKPSQREFCGRCHAQDAKSAADIPRVDLASHGGAYVCWQCHYPHHPED